MGRRRTGPRQRKFKKGLNRYDPANPVYADVHRPGYLKPRFFRPIMLKGLLLHK